MQFEKPQTPRETGCTSGRQPRTTMDKSRSSFAILSGLRRVFVAGTFDTQHASVTSTEPAELVHAQKASGHIDCLHCTV